MKVSIPTMQILAIKAILIFAGLIAMNAVCAQTEVTIMNSAADAGLNSAVPTVNDGSGNQMFTHPWGASYSKRGIIRFDVSSIPSGSIITSATLVLYQSSTYGSTRSLAVHRVTQSWVEGEVSWSKRTGSQSWSTYGGSFVSTPTSTQTVSWDGILDSTSWNVTADVAAFVSGATDNNGWMLKDAIENTSQQWWAFGTKENTNPAKRPKLLITYYQASTGSTVPRYWVAAASGNWNNASNWSLTDGGSGGAGIPGSSNDVYFTRHANGHCNVNAAVDILNFNMVSDYSGGIGFGSEAHSFRVRNAFKLKHGSAAFDATKAGFLRIDGDLLLTRNILVAPDTGKLFISGTWTHTGGQFVHNGGTVVFNGANTQYQSTQTHFNKVIIDKNSGASLTIPNNNIFTITSRLTLTQGLVFNTEVESLVLDCGATAIGGSATSYVSGPFTWTLCSTAATNMYFPIGKGTLFRPLWLYTIQQTNDTTAYTAEQFEGYPPNWCIPSDLSCLSKVRWFRITQEVTPVLDPITISYGPEDGVTHPSKLRIAKQVGNCWVNLGGQGTGSPSGTITSTVDFSDYGDFALANDTDCMNPLPVSLMDFSGYFDNGIEHLSWVTASEENNSHFEVERSTDMKIWEVRGVVEGMGNSTSINHYTFEESVDIPIDGVYHYRLRQVDFNGAVDYSPSFTQHFSTDLISRNPVKFYPNPAGNTLTLQNFDKRQKLYEVRMVNLAGQEVWRGELVGKMSISMENIPTGMYTVMTSLPNGAVVQIEKLMVH